MATQTLIFMASGGQDSWRLENPPWKEIVELVGKRVATQEHLIFPGNDKRPRHYVKHLVQLLRKSFVPTCIHHALVELLTLEEGKNLTQSSFNLFICLLLFIF